MSLDQLKESYPAKHRSTRNRRPRWRRVGALAVIGTLSVVAWQTLERRRILLSHQRAREILDRLDWELGAPSLATGRR